MVEDKRFIAEQLKSAIEYFVCNQPQCLAFACSSSDKKHDALLTLYDKQYSEHVETATTDVILSSWE